ncbi:MAG: LytR/AlgR family response regulator transcription factor [Steroidobacteraceae bacterium]
MIRTLIVDDEPPARDQVREFLADEPDVLVVGESGDGQEALRHIRTLQPELLFMDIRMPNLSGLEVLRSGLEPPLPLHHLHDRLCQLCRRGVRPRGARLPAEAAGAEALSRGRGSGAALSRA